MRLKVYLALENKNVAEFSKELDYNRRHVLKVVNGQLFPGPKLMKKIDEVTGGKVTMTDFHKEHKEILEKEKSKIMNAHESEKKQTYQECPNADSNQDTLAYSLV